MVDGGAVDGAKEGTAMKTCPNCGERVYSLGCTNCNENAYIEDQVRLTELLYGVCGRCGSPDCLGACEIGADESTQEARP